MFPFRADRRQQVRSPRHRLLVRHQPAPRRWLYVFGSRISGYYVAAPEIAAISCWAGCRDPIIERNELYDNSTGIRLGNAESATAGSRSFPFACASADGYFDAVGGTSRNNIIYGGPSVVAADAGIAIWGGCGTRVLHNTVITETAPFSSIEWRWDSDIELSNNLVSHTLFDRGGTALERGNIEGADLGWFVDLPSYDLHLRAEASVPINAGTALPPRRRRPARLRLAAAGRPARCRCRRSALG